MSEFDYPKKLHYSQTSSTAFEISALFDYPKKLHYSQTSLSPSTAPSSLITLRNYTTLKPQKSGESFSAPLHSGVKITKRIKPQY